MTEAIKDVKTGANSKGLSLLAKDWGFVVKALLDVDVTIIRYNDSLAIERIKSKLDGIRKRDYWTEEDLMDECFVRSIRTPSAQRIVFTDAYFIDELRMLNNMRGILCSQLVWYIRILSADGAEPKTSWPCLLQITPKRFYAAKLGDPESAFPGACLRIADAYKRIVEVETNVEERI